MGSSREPRHSGDTALAGRRKPAILREEALAYRVNESRAQQPLLPLGVAAPLPARPFLKWAGGKTSLVPVLRQFVPRHFKRYFEPFLGGGAMFFDLQPEQAILSDANEELINCYQVVKEQPEPLLRELERYAVSTSEFYRIRALNPASLSPVARAARTIYLNKTCFNGLYRVNRRGHFNTPFGNYKTVKLADEDNLLAVSEALQSATLLAGPYARLLLEQARPGDFIYLDPPYIPVSAYSDFKRYTSRQFRTSDHRQLAQVFRALDARGCLLLLSNSCHTDVWALFADFRIVAVQAPRFINCKPDGRGEVQELLVCNF